MSECKDHISSTVWGAPGHADWRNTRLDSLETEFAGLKGTKKINVRHTCSERKGLLYSRSRYYLRGISADCVSSSSDCGLAGRYRHDGGRQQGQCQDCLHKGPHMDCKDQQAETAVRMFIDL